MKKSILMILFVLLLFSSCKKQNNEVAFALEGKEYAARWMTNSNNRQTYVHLRFEANNKVVLFTSIEKILTYGSEPLKYTKSGDNYIIEGTLIQDYYQPKGTKISWTITPTKEPSYEGSPAKSTFDVGELHFIAQ